MTAMLKFCSPDTIEYCEGGRVVVEEVSSLLTVLWSEDGTRIKGIRLLHSRFLAEQLGKILEYIGKDFPSDNLPLPWMMEVALVGVYERQARENRGEKEFRDLSKAIRRFVFGMMIPCEMAKEITPMKVKEGV